MIDVQHLRDLLARYEAAETSLAEERELKTLLAAEDLPREFFADRDLFLSFQVLAKAEPQASPNRTPAPWEQPEVAAVRPAQFARKPNYRKPRSNFSRYRLAIAAGIALLATIALTLVLGRLTPTSNPVANNVEVPAKPAIDWSKYEVTDPAEAKEITQKALVGLSNQLDRGSRITAREVRRIEPIHHAFPTN